MKQLTTAAALCAIAVAASHASAAPTLRFPGFKTPSGNIVCVYDGRALRCDIRSGLIPKASRPPGCPPDIDFGQGVDISARRAGVVCAGDTALGTRVPKLAYGHVWRRGSIRCRSRVTGLACRNKVGHGFFLSGGRWHVY